MHSVVDVVIESIRKSSLSGNLLVHLKNPLMSCINGTFERQQPSVGVINHLDFLFSTHI